MIGQRLGHYRIEDKLGEGGMGVVYKARDTRLDRFVALKVLPPGLVADPERKRRFVQEAKTASALNHPNIITIHDIASHAGRDFIVMEYVAGRTLDQAIGRKGLKLNETLKYAVQMADALAAAHAAGIIHRDLKPGNVMITETGLVKALDFGLAKLTEPQAGERAPTQTAEGTIVGTVAYMSPEQAEGTPVDARSDIFTFGSVLYEMTTGRRAFHGDSAISTLAAIINQEPTPLSAEIPHDLQTLVTRCLRKDPARRFQHMDDVKVALEELREALDSGRVAAAPIGVAGALKRRKLVWSVPLAGVILIAGLVAWRLSRTAQPSPAALREVPLTTYRGSESYPPFSPDGKQVAFSWDGAQRDNVDVYIKLIGPGEPLRLTKDPAPDISPAWSPDGRFIAFLRAQPGQRREVLVIPALGGVERKLAEVGTPPELTAPFLACTPDSEHLIALDRDTAGGPHCLFLLGMESGDRRRLTAPPATALGDTGPAVSPDGRSLAFARYSGVELSGPVRGPAGW